MFLNLLTKKAFVGGRIVHRNLLRLNWEKCRFFILLLIEFMPFFTEKVSEKGREREESGPRRIQCTKARVNVLQI